jgi:hypothetical protein
LAHNKTSLSAKRQTRSGSPQPQQHRIIDDAAILGGDEDVLALADPTVVYIARNQHIPERERVRTTDLDLALDTHIPQSDTMQMPVLLHRIAAVPGAGEAGRVGLTLLRDLSNMSAWPSLRHPRVL